MKPYFPPPIDRFLIEMTYLSKEVALAESEGESGYLDTAIMLRTWIQFYGKEKE